MRKRIIRKYDNGWVIRLLQQDIEDLCIADYDMIDLDDCTIIKSKNDTKK